MPQGGAGAGAGTGTGTGKGPLLHCHDVWFAAQLPWRATDAFASGCLFSVVQSTAVGPNGEGSDAGALQQQYMSALSLSLSLHQADQAQMNQVVGDSKLGEVEVEPVPI